MGAELVCSVTVASICILAARIHRIPEEYENYHMNGRTRPAGKLFLWDSILYILHVK